MPGSIDSVPESPQILTYVGSVGFLVFSLMLSAYGYINNAWIVLSSENDEFQRGVRGFDCFRTYNPKNISCLPWNYENKTDKFPVPFNQVIEASWLVNTAYYFALVILISQFFWLSYAVGLCCSLKFCQKVVVYKLALFHVMVTAVGLWIILFIIFIFETFTENLLPLSLKTPEYEYHIGTGCWFFFLGGAIPFVGALYCLFGEQMQQSQRKMIGYIRKREAVDTEMQPTH